MTEWGTYTVELPACQEWEKDRQEGEIRYLLHTEATDAIYERSLLEFRGNLGAFSSDVEVERAEGQPMLLFKGNASISYVPTPYGLVAIVYQGVAPMPDVPPGPPEVVESEPAWSYGQYL